MSVLQPARRFAQSTRLLALFALASVGCGDSGDGDEADGSAPIDDVVEDVSDGDTAPGDTVEDVIDDAEIDGTDATEIDGPDEVIEDTIDGETDATTQPPEEIWAVDLAIEEGGETAIVTTVDGFLLRADLTSMQVENVLASGLTGPAGVAIESAGASVVVAERDAGRLLRIDLDSGVVTTLADGLDYPQGVALEPGDSTVLVAEGVALSRVTLSTGDRQVLSEVVQYGRDVVVEAGGESALVVESGQLTRVELSTGVTSPVVTEAAVGEGQFQGALALSGDGGEALLNTDLGCLVTVDLVSKSSQRLGCLYGNDQMALAIESGDAWAILGTDGQLMRVNRRPVIERVLERNDGLQWVVVEDGGTTALVLAEEPGVDTPRLYRLSLESGELVTVATLSDYLGASGLVVESSGETVLALGQGVVDNGGVTALVRVDLATGAVTEITRDLDQCTGSDVGLSADGASALIPCAPRLYRVALDSGAVTVATTGLDPGGVAVSADGTQALFSTLSGRELWLVELPAGEPRRVGRNLFASSPPGTGCTDVVYMPDGQSALVTQTGLYGGPYGETGRVVQVDLLSGAVSVVVAGALDAPGTFTCGTVGISLEPGGSTALVAETHGGVTRVALPGP